MELGQKQNYQKLNIINLNEIKNKKNYCYDGIIQK